MHVQFRRHASTRLLDTYAVWSHDHNDETPSLFPSSMRYRSRSFSVLLLFAATAVSVKTSCPKYPIKDFTQKLDHAATDSTAPAGVPD